MGHTETYPTPIFCDNSSSIAFPKHHVFQKKRKHFDTRYHFIHELVDNGDITLSFFGSKEQLADMFTKPLGTSTFEFHKQHLGIHIAEDIVPVETKGEC